jgi:hypothetical protein
MPTKPNVGPSKVLATHDFALSWNGAKAGFKYANGQRSVFEQAATPSTINVSGGGTKFGDWDPDFSHIEQRTWLGGRANNDFSTDSSRFFDSKDMFTMLENRVVPTLQWKLATGLRTALQTLPGDVNWKSLIGSSLYMASTFTVGGSALAADNVSIWLRRVGSPGALTVEIWTDSSGEPGSLVASATASVDTTDIIDVISEFRTFDLSAAGDLTAATAYWVVVYGAIGSSKANHWEVAADIATTNSKISSDGSTWNNSTFTMYSRVADADTNRQLRLFEMNGALFALDLLASGGSSTIYMNGEMGKATSGAAGHLTDTDKGLSTAWDNDEWNGWYIKIVKGTGQGQHRLISDVTSAGVITPATNWDIAPDSTSQYVIYGGDAWQSFASGAVVKDVAVFNNIAYMAQGLSTFIRSFYFEPADSPPALVFYDDTANYADFFHVFPDTVDGPQLWRGENDFSGDGTVVSRSGVVAIDTDLSFKDDIKIGDISFPITNLFDYDKKLYVWKYDGVYTFTKDRVEKLNVGLDIIKNANSGQAAVVHNMFLMFSWGNFTIQRLYGNDLTNIGYQKGIGLPSNRAGLCAWLASHPAGIFACVDAGDSKTSSLLFYEDQLKGWHEVFRAPAVGWRIRHVFWQDNPGTRPRLWIECNGELFYQEWPKDTFSPIEDSGINFQHEGVVELADIDMGQARLKKMFKELSILSENLASGIEIFLEYQTDKDIGTTKWISQGRVGISPEADLQINEGGRNKIRLRLRLVSNDADVPAVLIGTVLQGFSRTPFKRIWTVRVKTSSFQVTGVGTRDTPPSDTYQFLKQLAEAADFALMDSKYPEMHDVQVIVEPFSYQRESVNTTTKTQSGVFEFVMREA